MRAVAIAVMASLFYGLSYADEIVTCPAPSQYKAIAGQHPLGVDGWQALSTKKMFKESPVEVLDASKLSVIAMLQTYDGLRASLNIDFYAYAPDDTYADPFLYSLDRSYSYTYYVLCTYDEKTKYLIYKLPATLEDCTVTSTGMNCK